MAVKTVSIAHTSAISMPVLEVAGNDDETAAFGGKGVPHRKERPALPAFAEVDRRAGIHSN